MRTKTKAMSALILTAVMAGFPFIVAANTVKTWATVYYGPDLAAAYLDSRLQQVRETLDGGYIAVANYTPYGTGKKKVWVIKFDSSGNLAWQQTYGASGDDYANSIAVSADGGYVVAGYTSSFGNGSSVYAWIRRILAAYISLLGHGSSNDAWIMKIDGQGGIAWQKNIRFTIAGGNKKFNMVQQTSDSGYIAVGEASVGINGSINAFIVKFDVDGNILWWKMYGHGDAYYDRAYWVQQTPDEEFIISGSSNNNAWIFKLDAQGILKWQKAYAVSNSRSMVANSVHLTSDGGYVAAGGYVDLATRQQEAYIMKLDAEGTVQQQKLFKMSPSYGSSSVFTIEEIKDSEYIVLGSLSNHSWIMKLDQNWNTLWQHSYYGTWYGISSDYFSTMQPASDGGYILAGYAISFDADKKQQAILLKVDSKGNLGGCAASLVHDITPSVLTKNIVPVGIAAKTQTAQLSASSGPASVLNAEGSKGTVCVDKDPQIAISPPALDFGALELPGESSKAVTIANTGYEDLIISRISITGLDADVFTQTNNCSTVAPNESCSAVVTFSASSAGAWTAYLSISSNDPGTPAAAVPLSGTAGDTIAPVSTTMITGKPGAHNWYVSDVTINITATDYGSGAREIHYRVDGSGAVVPGDSAELSLVSNGTHTVNYYAVDNAGNVENPHVLTLMIDKSAPDISASGTPLPNGEGWNNTDVTVTFTCHDAPSGIAECPAPVTVSAEGANQEVTGTAIDQAGNQASASIQLNIDKTPPLITPAVNRNPNADGWNNADVTITFTCTDTLSGISSCPPPVTVTTEGEDQVITGTAVDKAGNMATASVTLNIDKTPPSINLSAFPEILWPTNHKMDFVSISGSATDEFSGVASTGIAVTDEYGIYNIAVPGFGSTIELESWRDGTDLNGRHYTITAVATDKAGNKATATATVLVPHNTQK